MINLKKEFKNKKILITGHTGFKGSWLTSWLTLLGAKVVGVSKDIPTNPSHFKNLRLKNKIKHHKFDLKNYKKLKKLFLNTKPHYVFHLAAQALIKKSYAQPVETVLSNTVGTLNLLDCLRHSNHKCVAIFITSDKVYRNLELKRGYNEKDILGGKDLYSASKASAEIIIKSYFESYFNKKNSKVLLGIARAGNVIGGGDWSMDRLIPDCIKSWSKKKKVILRNPNSTRPWQHVIEAIWGYMLFSLKLNKNPSLSGEAFNFGPNNNADHKVINLVKLMNKSWEDAVWKFDKKNFFYESKLLKLNSNKAKKYLKWKCIMSFSQTVKMVAEWYKSYYKKSNHTIITDAQIKYYMKLLNLKN